MFRVGPVSCSSANGITSSSVQITLAPNTVGSTKDPLEGQILNQFNLYNPTSPQFNTVGGFGHPVWNVSALTIKQRRHQTTAPPSLIKRQQR
jgi:hypothetical protein